MGRHVLEPQQIFRLRLGRTAFERLDIWRFATLGRAETLIVNYLLNVSDDRNRNLIVLTLDESMVRLPAGDVVFDILGANVPEELVASGQLPAGQVEDFKSLQKIIFDSDAQGPFIRDTIHFKANGKVLDPDGPMSRGFAVSERDGMKYMRCDLMVIDKAEHFKASASASLGLEATAEASWSVEIGGGEQSHEKSTSDHIEDLSRVMFLHQIAIGALIDVTKDHPELEEVIAYAEREGLIEIDVKTAAYKLTGKGKRMHDSFIAEAQDLIKRFDIYGDVDIDESGNAHFDTGLGRDLRVPVYEMEGVDPFRARFLLGLNDGEWDQLSNWTEVFRKESWYREIFVPIERAPSIEEIGHDQLARIIAQAKIILREEGESR